MVLPAVLAHQGGWDEMLFVAIPIVLFVLLLRMANRRADRQVSSPAGTSPAVDRPPDPAGAADDTATSRPDPDAAGTRDRNQA